ncbi:MAG TPA: NAD-dependent epimerase/dehydratase family protein [Candidatus Angelobacter sp.]|nr:NAD-dependent epimerase/dehydratase family protein [Candidatus Angelobacter sp.]
MARDKIVCTGAAGFAGAHIVSHLMANTDWDIIALDRLSYAGSLERLSQWQGNSRLKFVFHDFRATYPASVLKAMEGARYFIHNGAETHVERSIQDPEPFVMSNVLGTMTTLQAARALGVDHFIYVSTDEVHGPAPKGVDFTEESPVRPSNPYSASKAGGEALAFAWWKCYRLPVTCTRTMNLIGETQHPEKFVPLCIKKILRDEKVIIHGINDGAGRWTIGARKWIHARNQADALLYLLKLQAKEGTTRAAAGSTHGETFHIAGEERSNLEIAQFIAKTLNKKLNYETVDVYVDRPGHDLRYSLSDEKIKALGWKAPMAFEESLRRCVEWSVRPENASWLEE